MPALTPHSALTTWQFLPAVTALLILSAAGYLYAVVVTATHLTPLRELALENPALHAAEHALYLVTGYLYFLPVIGAEPLRWRPSLLGRYLLLLVAMVPDTAVGVVLMSFLENDLHQGGLIMLAGSDLIMTGLAMALAASLVWSSEIGAQQGQVGG